MIERYNQSAGRYLTALLVAAAAVIHVRLAYIKGAHVSHWVSREDAQSRASRMKQQNPINTVCVARRASFYLQASLVLLSECMGQK